MSPLKSLSSSQFTESYNLLSSLPSIPLAIQLAVLCMSNLNYFFNPEFPPSLLFTWDLCAIISVLFICKRFHLCSSTIPKTEYSFSYTTVRMILKKSILSLGLTTFIFDIALDGWGKLACDPYISLNRFLHLPPGIPATWPLFPC